MSVPLPFAHVPRQEPRPAGRPARRVSLPVKSPPREESVDGQDSSD